MEVFGIPLFDGPLTKKTLFALQLPVYIVSNAMVPPDAPVIRELLSTTKSRQALWEKVERAELSGTPFRAFPDASEYLLWKRFKGSRYKLLNYAIARARTYSGEGL